MADDAKAPERDPPPQRPAPDRESLDRDVERTGLLAHPWLLAGRLAGAALSVAILLGINHLLAGVLLFGWDPLGAWQQGAEVPVDRTPPTPVQPRALLEYTPPAPPRHPPRLNLSHEGELDFGMLAFGDEPPYLESTVEVRPVVPFGRSRPVVHVHAPQIEAAEGTRPQLVHNTCFGGGLAAGEGVCRLVLRWTPEPGETLRGQLVLKARTQSRPGDTELPPLGTTTLILRGQAAPAPPPLLVEAAPAQADFGRVALSAGSKAVALVLRVRNRRARIGHVALEPGAGPSLALEGAEQCLREYRPGTGTGVDFCRVSLRTVPGAADPGTLESAVRVEWENVLGQSALDAGAVPDRHVLSVPVRIVWGRERPVVAIRPQALEFGREPWTDEGAPARLRQRVRVEAEGASAVVTDVALHGRRALDRESFTLDAAGCRDASLRPTASCAVDVTWDPQAPGAAEATLEVSYQVAGVVRRASAPVRAEAYVPEGVDPAPPVAPGDPRLALVSTPAYFSFHREPWDETPADAPPTRTARVRLQAAEGTVRLRAAQVFAPTEEAREGLALWPGTCGFGREPAVLAEGRYCHFEAAWTDPRWEALLDAVIEVRYESAGGPADLPVRLLGWRGPRARLPDALPGPDASLPVWYRPVAAHEAPRERLREADPQGGQLLAGRLVLDETGEGQWWTHPRTGERVWVLDGTGPGRWTVDRRTGARRWTLEEDARGQWVTDSETGARRWLADGGAGAGQWWTDPETGERRWLADGQGAGQWWTDPKTGERVWVPDGAGPGRWVTDPATGERRWVLDGEARGRWVLDPKTGERRFVADGTGEGQWRTDPATGERVWVPDGAGDGQWWTDPKTGERVWVLDGTGPGRWVTDPATGERRWVLDGEARGQWVVDPKTGERRWLPDGEGDGQWWTDPATGERVWVPDGTGPGRWVTDPATGERRWVLDGDPRGRWVTDPVTGERRWVPDGTGDGQWWTDPVTGERVWVLDGAGPGRWVTDPATGERRWVLDEDARGQWVTDPETGERRFVADGEGDGQWWTDPKTGERVWVLDGTGPGRWVTDPATGERRWVLDGEARGRWVTDSATGERRWVPDGAGRGQWVTDPVTGERRWVPDGEGRGQWVTDPVTGERRWVPDGAGAGRWWTDPLTGARVWVPDGTGPGRWETDPVTGERRWVPDPNARGQWVTDPETGERRFVADGEGRGQWWTDPLTGERVWVLDGTGPGRWVTDPVTGERRWVLDAGAEGRWIVDPLTGERRFAYAPRPGTGVLVRDPRTGTVAWLADPQRGGCREADPATGAPRWVADARVPGQWVADPATGERRWVAEGEGRGQWWTDVLTDERVWVLDGTGPGRWLEDSGDGVRYWVLDAEARGQFMLDPDTRVREWVPDGAGEGRWWDDPSHGERVWVLDGTGPARWVREESGVARWRVYPRSEGRWRLSPVHRVRLWVRSGAAGGQWRGEGERRCWHPDGVGPGQWWRDPVAARVVWVSDDDDAPGDLAQDRSGVSRRVLARPLGGQFAWVPERGARRFAPDGVHPGGTWFDDPAAGLAVWVLPGTGPGRWREDAAGGEVRWEVHAGARGVWSLDDRTSARRWRPEGPAGGQWLAPVPGEASVWRADGTWPGQWVPDDLSGDFLYFVDGQGPGVGRGDVRRWVLADPLGGQWALGGAGPARRWTPDGEGAGQWYEDPVLGRRVWVLDGAGPGRWVEQASREGPRWRLAPDALGRWGVDLRTGLRAWRHDPSARAHAVAPGEEVPPAVRYVDPGTGEEYTLAPEEAGRWEVDGETGRPRRVPEAPEGAPPGAWALDETGRYVWRAREEEETVPEADEEVPVRVLSRAEQVVLARRSLPVLAPGVGRIVLRVPKAPSRKPPAEPPPEALPYYDASYRVIGIDPQTSSRPVHLGATVLRNTPIRAVVGSRINGRYPTMITATVEADVFSRHGRNAVIPGGSLVVGMTRPVIADGATRAEVVAALAAGLRRLEVDWERIVRPDGTAFDVRGALYTSDVMGQAGIPGRVDARELEVYAALLASRGIEAAGILLTVPELDLDGCPLSDFLPEDPGEEGYTEAMLSLAQTSQQECIALAQARLANPGPREQAAAALRRGVGEVTDEMRALSVPPPTVTVSAGTRILLYPLQDLVLAARRAPAVEGAGEGVPEGEGAGPVASPRRHTTRPLTSAEIEAMRKRGRRGSRGATDEAQETVGDAAVRLHDRTGGTPVEEAPWEEAGGGVSRPVEVPRDPVGGGGAEGLFEGGEYAR